MIKRDDPAKVLTWLQTRPGAHALREAFPEEWQTVEQELGEALVARDPSRLHRLLQPAHQSNLRGQALGKREKGELVRAAVRQRMATLAIRQYSLAVAARKPAGKARFNLFNGLLAQKLLFRRGLERKPVSLKMFRLVWPLIWQKKLLMPLVERKGIYCFYSREFIDELAGLAAGRPCLEIAAGDGTLSRFLREQGVAVTATDDHSWSDRIAFPASVHKLDAQQALRTHAPGVVLCAWPPAQNTFERQVFSTRSVELYIVIVSAYRFASGNWRDYEAQQAFRMERRPDLARLLLPPELQCEVLTFQRIDATNT